MDWSGVDYCDVFIRLSFWWHPFTEEHPLLRHWCRDTFLQTWWRNKLILISDGLRVNTNFYFWLNYSFNKTQWILFFLTPKHVSLTSSGSSPHQTHLKQLNLHERLTSSPGIVHDFVYWESLWLQIVVFPAVPSGCRSQTRLLSLTKKKFIEVCY